MPLAEEHGMTRSATYITLAWIVLATAGVCVGNEEAMCVGIILACLTAVLATFN